MNKHQKFPSHAAGRATAVTFPPQCRGHLFLYPEVIFHHWMVYCPTTMPIVLCSGLVLHPFGPLQYTIFKVKCVRKSLHLSVVGQCGILTQSHSALLYTIQPHELLGRQPCFTTVRSIQSTQLGVRFQLNFLHDNRAWLIKSAANRHLLQPSLTYSACRFKISIQMFANKMHLQ